MVKLSHVMGTLEGAMLYQLLVGSLSCKQLSSQLVIFRIWESRRYCYLAPRVMRVKDICELHIQR